MPIQTSASNDDAPFILSLHDFVNLMNNQAISLDIFRYVFVLFAMTFSFYCRILLSLRAPMFSCLLSADDLLTFLHCARANWALHPVRGKLSHSGINHLFVEFQSVSPKPNTHKLCFYPSHNHSLSHLHLILTAQRKILILLK